MSVKIQTLFSPLISSLLYVAVFGLPMQQMPSQIEGISFLEFLIPGLIMMGMISNAFQNSASSLMIAKYSNTIFEILTWPISSFEKVSAYMFAGALRGILVGAITYLAVLPFVALPIESPLIVIVVSALVCSTFSALGIVAGVWAKNFDQMTILNQFLILPLTFLGGVFYSIQRLSPFFQKVTLVNPILYMIDALRYGFLGVSDLPIYFSLSLLVVFQFLAASLAWWVFHSGYRLQT